MVLLAFIPYWTLDEILLFLNLFYVINLNNVNYFYENNFGSYVRMWYSQETGCVWKWKSFKPDPVTYLYAVIMITVLKKTVLLELSWNSYFFWSWVNVLLLPLRRHGDGPISGFCVWISGSVYWIFFYSRITWVIKMQS